MRLLLAKRISTNQWYQRVDTGIAKLPEEFRAEVAAQFSEAEGDVEVVERAEGTEAQHLGALAALKAGTYEGLGVIAAPPSVQPRDPERLHAGLRSHVAGH